MNFGPQKYIILRFDCNLVKVYFEESYSIQGMGSWHTVRLLVVLRVWVAFSSWVFSLKSCDGEAYKEKLNNNFYYY